MPYYLFIKYDDGSVDTFSYHPTPWATSLIDSNWRRPARVWQNDPRDNFYESDLTGILVRIESMNGKQEIMRDAITAYLDSSGVGYELGEHIDAGGSNTKGVKRSRPPTADAPAYFVGGQNCANWVIKMLTAIGADISEEEMDAITEKNGGHGVYRHLPSNDAMPSAAYDATVDETSRKWNSFRRWWTLEGVPELRQIPSW
ncbi:MAG: hypothetical protein KF851_07370 [Pirellulaceae bacterium]|nr:hypothetical protein [Pirellulaceae bacterium]